MTRNELIAAVWSKHVKSLSLADVERIIETTFKQMACALAHGDKILIPNFGSFEVKERAARNGTNPRTGEPMVIKKAKLGGLCVLTSRMPETVEAERFIFGIFLADKLITEVDNDSEYIVAVESLSEYKLKFSENQARHLLFWKYHSNENDSVNPRWGSGLHRYISDAEAVQILRDAVEVKRGTHDEKLAQNFLEYFCSIQNIDSNDVWEPNGALTIAK